MGSRERDSKSLQDKLKVFFNKKGGAAAGGEVSVAAEAERELGAGAAPARRARALRDLAERAATQRVHEGTYDKVWRLTRDVLEDAAPAGVAGAAGAAGGAEEEARAAALAWWRAAAEGGGRLAGRPVRTVLLRWLRARAPRAAAPDAPARLRLLHALTDAGRDISCFEEEMGPLVCAWAAAAAAAGEAGGGGAARADVLRLATNVVKFNANALDEPVVHDLVHEACRACEGGLEEAVVVAGLALLEAVLAYSWVPERAAPRLARALCATLGAAAHAAASWRVMRCVLAGDAGHQALLHLLALLRAPEPAPPGLRRAAAFYVAHALWGPQRVHSLRASCLAVLPAFLKAVECGVPAVTHEVLVGLSALVARVPADPLELHEPAWDVLLRTLQAAVHQDGTLEPRNELLHTQLHALITSVEQLQAAGQYAGDAGALLDLLDSCGPARPERSAMWVVTQRAAALSPARAWPAAALALAERYVRQEPRPAVRLHALAAVLGAAARHRAAYGDELAERVAVPVLTASALDAQPALRAAAATHLAELVRVTSSDACADLIDLLEKILNRPFDEGAEGAADAPVPADAAEAEAPRLAAGALRGAVHARLPRSPPAHAARALLALLDHLRHHYRRPALFQHHPDIRIQILDMVFGLRANQFNWVGFCYDEKGAPLGGAAALRVPPRCSPLLLVEPPAPRGAAPRERDPPPPPGTCVLSAALVARAVLEVLAREAEWPVLAHVLRLLPGALDARALCVGRRARELDQLAGALVGMLCDRSLGFPECVRAPAPPGRLLLSEFHGAVLPALAALPPYHAYLEPHTQYRLVRCLLKYGMVLRRPQPYITALSMLTLEMRDTMVRMLPEVLLDLSKVSDTKLIASPMLEFLSTLTRLPRVYASFVEDQYMSVFAIVLPYTNPSRYDHYVVSLAHHVIAAWFLKCRLSYRTNFVRFIIHGLHNYILMPFEEQLSARAPPPANEDSSTRQRSSSLGSRRPARGGPAGAGGGAGAGGAGASAAFHVELTETCVDLLARYAHTPCAVKPQRSDVSSLLFAGGPAGTWLVGHKLVTVTTAGCLHTALRHGLCDRCRQHAPPAQPAPPAPPAPPAQAQAAGEGGGGGGGGGGGPAGEEAAEEAAAAQRAGEAAAAAAGAAAGAAAAAAGAAAGGACVCWCGAWAEVRVRAPSGDVAWTTRLHNQLQRDAAAECALQDAAALLAAPPAAPTAPTAPAAAPAVQAQASGPRARSGSASAPRAPPAPAPAPADLHKSSSDSVVAPPAAAPPAAPARPAHMASTAPINIPGSPQRQSSSSTTDDDDMLLVVPKGKARHPVRRSNSSPEMSSWKLAAPAAAEPIAAAAEPLAEPPRAHDPDDMIVLPVCEPTGGGAAAAGAGAAGAAGGKKAGKKSDLRVSCEAIPEEMSGTSPLAPPALPAPPAQPPLRTHYSDPGEADAAAAPADLQKTASDSTVAGAGAGGGRPPAAPRALGDDLPPLARSKRSNTISVMSPTRRHRESAPAARAAGGGAPSGGGGSGGGGVTPAFVFLQLYHNMSTYPISPPVPGEAAALLNPLAERPLRVSGTQHERTIKNLDLVPPVDTFKIGVLYVAAGQHDNEVAILQNEYGSVRYAEFLRGLGALVALADAPPDLFLNLERDGRDGSHAHVWTDDVLQVVFHVATAMPTTPRDPTCNEKRKYIGNDFVSIVYNDSGADFNIHTIKGQFNFCIVVVEPRDHGLHRVLVKCKDERAARFLAHLEPHCVTDASAALLARQTALHCALASQISQSLTLGGAPYASNSLERLRLIKRVRRRAEAERLAAAARAPAPYAGSAAPHLAQRVAIDDFNDYT